MFRRKKNEAGFTLIEWLIAISLIAIVGLAIYGIFDSGIKVMQRIIRPVPGEDLNIFFEKLSQDLQNAFHYTDIRFKGEPEKVVFAASIQNQPGLGGDQGIGEVIYTYDQRGLAIFRQQKNVSELYEEKARKAEKGNQLQGTPVLNHILSLRFQYYGFVPEDKEFFWLDNWEEVDQKMGLPFALRVEIVFEEEGAKQHFVRAITIPVSG